MDVTDLLMAWHTTLKNLVRQLIYCTATAIRFSAIDTLVGGADNHLDSIDTRCYDTPTEVKYQDAATNAWVTAMLIDSLTGQDPPFAVRPVNFELALVDGDALVIGVTYSIRIAGNYAAFGGPAAGVVGESFDATTTGPLTVGLELASPTTNQKVWVIDSVRRGGLEFVFNETDGDWHKQVLTGAGAAQQIIYDENGITIV